MLRRVARTFARLAANLRAGAMLYRAGASWTSIVLYPVRRRLRHARSQLDLRNGYRILAPADEPLLFLFREVWAEHAYDPFDEPIRSHGAPTVVDIGAHVGLFALWATSRWPGVRVIAVEASPRAAHYLRSNVSHNNLSDVMVIEKACGGSRRRAYLHRGRSEMMSSLYGLDGGPGDGYEVEVITLDDLFRDNRVERCDLLKLDCEGSEYEIILGASGATLERVERIAMECHRGLGGEPADLVLHLEAAGFSVRLAPSAHDLIHEYLFAARPAR